MKILMPSSLIFFVLLQGCDLKPAPGRENRDIQDNGLCQETTSVKKIIKTDQEWKKILTAEEYRVLRKAGTERAFSGKYNDHYEPGIYVCAACGTPLFASESKYDHGTGWPSFSAPIDKTHLDYRNDYSLLAKRVEVRCATCGSHLGHVFDDGPTPTGKHYCINSVALNFRPADSIQQKERREQIPSEKQSSKTTETATFAAGCFWGVEDKFLKIQGVLSTRVGYTGGTIKNPTYKLVCSDTTGHAEAIEIVFDPAVVTYTKLLERFFEFHDPTQVNRQGPDVGSQYRSAIFFHSEEQKKAALEMIEKLTGENKFSRPITTQVVQATEFYQAEDYHQKYYQKLRKAR
jgi:peptide methionine sulfoxide reductase msrA/msrB